MQAPRINLESTWQLHQAVGDSYRSQADALLSACHRANEALRQRGVEFEAGRPMPIVPSALVVRDAEFHELRAKTERLHGLVERALDQVLASGQLQARYFPEHQRMLPHLARTPGLASWQGISRYDAILAPDGRLRIIELNTACPAGFSDMHYIAQATKQVLSAQALAIPFPLQGYATIKPTAFCDGLLQIESQSQIPCGTVAILNDENELAHELRLFAESFRTRNRDVLIGTAADLRFAEGRLFYQDRYISLTYNKFRVSTESSHNHCWRPGFEDRYAALLAAMHEQSVVSINNLTSLTLAESKSLLAALRDPEVVTLFDDTERRFLDDTVVWTACLRAQHAQWREQAIDLLPFVMDHREQFVIKPANEGRGFGVLIGKYCTDAQWQAACRPDPDNPLIVQAYVEPVTVPVVHEQDGCLQSTVMYQTVSLATIAGEFQGMMARVSPDPVANVARRGFNQAVFSH